MKSFLAVVLSIVSLILLTSCGANNELLSENPESVVSVVSTPAPTLKWEPSGREFGPEGLYLPSEAPLLEYSYNHDNGDMLAVFAPVEKDWFVSFAQAVFDNFKCVLVNIEGEIYPIVIQHLDESLNSAGDKYAFYYTVTSETTTRHYVEIQYYLNGDTVGDIPEKAVRMTIVEDTWTP